MNITIPINEGMKTDAEQADQQWKAALGYQQRPAQQCSDCGEPLTAFEKGYVGLCDSCMKDIHCKNCGCPVAHDVQEDGLCDSCARDYYEITTPVNNLEEARHD